MRSFIKTVALAGVLCAAFDHAGAAPPPRSISTSRQFIVYGSDATMRAAICDLAENTKLAALHVLQQRDDWTTPIVINAQLPQAHLPEQPPARLHVGQTGFGLKLQLELIVGADVSGAAVERELLRAVFLEMMYRGAPDVAAGTPYVEPPEWLLEGTLALAPARDRAAMAGVLASAVASGNVMPLEQFLRQRPALLDSPSRELYRAYAGALVSALSDTPDKQTRLARFVSNLPQASNDPVGDLRAHFPYLGEDAEKMQRNWSAIVSRLASRGGFGLLSCEQSEQELVRVLRVIVPLKGEKEPTSYALEEFPKFVRNAAAAPSLHGLRQELLALSGRANPLYRPIVAEYEKIATQLARKKTGKLSERLAELRATREHIMRRMTAVADYLNWFEATQARTSSGAFRDYMKAAELATERAHRRRDAISVYLDALETQF